MKLLIILATLLLVPIVMKFQHQSLRLREVPGQIARIEALLEKNGVTAPEVEIQYFDATLRGGVANLTMVERLEGEVVAMPGIRRVVNELQVRSAFSFFREDDQLFAEGVVPEGWRSELVAGQNAVDLANLKEQSSATLSLGDATVWGLFIDRFFDQAGARKMAFDGEELELSGEATPQLARDLTVAAVRLTGRERLEVAFETFPSRFHFPSREVASPLEGEALRALQRSLLEETIPFQDGSSNLNDTGSARLQGVAEELQALDASVLLVVGTHPESKSEDAMRLARQRAEVAKRNLVAAGLSPASLETMVYEMTKENREIRGQVEILVR
jgi:outer membrane protein OmpA-like peptidoglycan-associated protein